MAQQSWNSEQACWPPPFASDKAEAAKHDFQAPLPTQELEEQLPHDEGLPETGDAQEIGQDALDCLRANRPKGWRLTDLGGDNDFGFDFQVQLSAEQQVLHPFRLQLKGTRSPKPNADFSHLSIPLSTSTLRYLDNADEPVLLALCDLSVEPREPRN